MTEHIPILIITVPLLAAFMLPIIGKINDSLRNWFLLLVILAVNVMIFSLIPDVALNGKTLIYVLGAKSSQAISPEGIAFPIRIILKVDAFSLFMAIISGIITMVAFLYSWSFIANDGKKNYYMLILTLMMVGMLGLEFTNDLFNFFVFLEILSISGAALVAYRTHEKHPPYAGYKYLLISAIATSFYLIGVALIYAQYTSFNITYLHSVIQYSLLDKIALVFIIISLAMKAGAFPMHMWVPDAYTEAPAPVTAMLVASSQASLYGNFRFSFSLFGNPVTDVSINFHTLGWIIIILGVLSMFIGVTMAIIQHDIKRLMAYHSVSQTGYMLLGIGVGLAVHVPGTDNALFKTFGKVAMAGGIFHIINYTFYKSLLFLTAGVIETRFGTRNLNKMVGLAHRDTFTTIAFIIGALAISGVPPFNGFASKLMIYESVYRFNPILSIIAMLVSILTLASFVKVFYSAFLGPRREDLIVHKLPLSAGMIISMSILCILIIGIGLFPDQFVHFIIDPAIKSLVKI
jgi:multicomponent Na+:H+ antiporter subunit D